MLYKVRKLQLIYCIIIFLSNIMCVTLLYTHYGPLTVNGNRYFHKFDIKSMDWDIFILCSLACSVLLVPYVFFNEPNSKRVFKIFPAKSSFGAMCSEYLSTINFTTGTIFTFFLVWITYVYHSNCNRVMAEDLETILLGGAYALCLIFWGIVDFVYLIFHIKILVKRNKLVQ